MVAGEGFGPSSVAGGDRVTDVLVDLPAFGSDSGPGGGECEQRAVVQWRERRGSGGVPAHPCDRLEKPVMGADGQVPAVVTHPFPAEVDGPVEGRQLLGGVRGRRASGHPWFQQQPHLEDLGEFLARRGRHERAPVRMELDEPSSCEIAEGLANRDPGHPEFVAQFRGDDVRAGAQVLAQDLVLQVAGDPVLQK